VAERAALITGGSSGIGLAIARALGEDGYGVTIAARRPEKLEAAADELRGEGLDVNSIAANMTDEEALAGVVRSHKERFGRLDVMVNNAGVGIGEAMHELTTKYVDMQLGVNLRAVIIGTREALPLLREAGAMPIAVFETEPALNDYPRLPVRTDEQVFAWLARVPSAAAWALAEQRLQAQRAWRDDVMPRLQAPSTRPARTLRLQPTTRSLLR